MAAPEIELQRLLREHGFTLERQTKHQVWKNPQGKTFVCAMTPSDKFAMQNALADLRRLVGWKPEAKAPKPRKEYRKPHVPAAPKLDAPPTEARPTMADQLRSIFKNND